MRTLIAVLVLITGLNAFAVPGRLYLEAPTKIEVVGTKLRLTFSLACKNEYPDEWAGNLVVAADDEGDMAVAVGVVLAESSCDPGPKKDYVFEYNLKQTGVTKADLANGVTFEPVDLRYTK